jgi:hypothetical protein
MEVVPSCFQSTLVAEAISYSFCRYGQAAICAPKLSFQHNEEIKAPNSPTRDTKN